MTDLGKDESLSSDIAKFLAPYGLRDYAPQFLLALKNNQLELISRRIREDKGLELITLENLPPFVRERFIVLVYPQGAVDNAKYFLFWKPELRFERFYFGYRGEKVKKLQRLLASFNYYRDDIDGIVGPNLMRAVVKFQKEMGLKISGYPDSRTLFMLSSLRESVQQNGGQKARQKAAG